MDKSDILINLNSDTILNGIADGVVVMGLDKKVLFINRAARKILGRTGEEDICGKNCGEIVGHSSCSLGCLVMQTVKTGENIYNYEAVFGRGGKEVTLSINTSVIRDGDGKIIGGVEIFRDISIIKELKSELKERYSLNNVVGKNYKMHEIYKLLQELAPTASTVLIEGESGTGKELIANAVHHNSPRSGRPFIKLNCAALAEGVIESELFGHVKGAFTGALAEKAGRFELADKGTLFLDEIGEINMQTQVKLLRVLQDGEFEKVGGTKSIKVDVRLIAATNKDLKEAVKKGEFREDLYYRLKVIPVHLPALRERKDDIPLLVKHFIAKFNKEMHMEVTNLSPRAMELLMDYNYPGNIRELEHIMEHAFVRGRGKTIHPEQLPEELRRTDLIEKVMDEDEPLKGLERETIIRTLNETDWKLQASARRLKIGRTTLWRKMKEFNLEKK